MPDDGEKSGKVIGVMKSEGRTEEKVKKWWMDILYEDEHILLINKLIGMIVHPNQSNQKGVKR